MNASFGDVFNDGRLSIYKTNISEPGVLVQANDLWVPKTQAGRRGAAEFENLASSLGVDLGGWSWGAQFGDLNNDGTLDLYLVNGYVSAGERTQLLVRLRARSPSGTAPSSATRRTGRRCKGRSLSGYQRKRVWINDGARPIHRRGAGRRRHRHLRRPRGGARRSLATAACSTSSSPTSAARC